jgi:hypothetical protein
MSFRSTLRAPYRLRTIVQSGAAGPVSEARLGRTIVLTQLVLLGLCAARIGADLLRGPLGIEGGIAVALFVALAASLVAKAFAWALRAATTGEKDMSSRSPTPTTVGASRFSKS